CRGPQVPCRRGPRGCGNGGRRQRARSRPGTAPGRRTRDSLPVPGSRCAFLSRRSRAGQTADHDARGPQPLPQALLPRPARPRCAGARGYLRARAVASYQARHEAAAAVRPEGEVCPEAPADFERKGSFLVLDLEPRARETALAVDVEQFDEGEDAGYTTAMRL